MENTKLVQNLQTCLRILNWFQKLSDQKIELITYVRLEFNSVCVLCIHLLTLSYFTLYTQQIIVLFYIS